MTVDKNNNVLETGHLTLDPGFKTFNGEAKETPNLILEKVCLLV